MKPEIHRLPLGFSNCYLIKDEGLVTVDAGQQGKVKKFAQKLRDLALDPQDISLIFLTHGHWDHIGLLHELKGLTRCPVAINQHEKRWVEQALKPLTPGTNLWGKALGALMKAFIMPSVDFPPVAVDLALEDEEFSLEPFGLHGRALHTPGHSSGSMSLLLDTGDAFVGDLAVGGLPQRFAPGMSVFAESPGKIRDSWRLLLDEGAKWTYPAHGKPFKAEVLERRLHGR